MESQDNRPGGEGQLFIVATPIGNLGDITYRAVETLKQASIIAVEDTRISGKLLARFGIDTPMMACHEHNEEQSAKKIISHLQAGRSVALISDAGTPLINDPGYRLVRMVRQDGFDVIPIPGASSPIVALSASGMPTDRFTYAGFFPRGGSSRDEELSRLQKATHTFLYLESPHRLVRTLEALEEGGMAGREVCVARELTKLHESFVSGSVTEVLAHYREHPPKGEIVLMIAPPSEPADVTDEMILAELNSEEMRSLPPSRRAGNVAKRLKVQKARVYALLDHRG